VEYEAATLDGRTTVINMTNHVYLNLRGAGNGDVLGHVLQIAASRVTAVDSPHTLIPTGVLTDVAGTELDFRTPRRIGDRIAAAHDGVGYDHNFVLDGWIDRVHQKETTTARRRAINPMRFAARVQEPESGRQLEVTTTQPGLQLYTGCWLDTTGKGGQHYGRWSGLCLETQHFPDSPNRPEFPTTVLRPGEVYHEVTTFTFSTFQ
jgi:aldose 1-epimerase